MKIPLNTKYVHKCMYKVQNIYSVFKCYTTQDSFFFMYHEGTKNKLFNDIFTRFCPIEITRHGDKLSFYSNQVRVVT